MHQIHLIISGRVQGVFYRASCQDIAVKYGLVGWVKNLPDGDVEVTAQGEKNNLERFIEWCKKGPPRALVSSVQVEWEEMTEEFKSFVVT